MAEVTTGTASGAGGRRSFLRTLAGAASDRPHLALVVLCLFVYLPGFVSMPPLDRDESRFAQASRQMLERNDFVNIRFQDGPRNKKPAGIHWLQAASAAAAGGPEQAGIWAYRLPSVIGAILAVLAIFHLGRLLFGARAGLLGAALMGVTGALIAEANISKTDAVLLATVVSAQFAIARFYLHARGRIEAPPGIKTVLLFWIALGAGILIKGPIMPMVIGLTILALSIADRDWSWLKGMRPLLGVPVAAAIVLPWGLAILFETQGQFYRESVGVDLIPKILGGVESHGFPPGFYLALVSLTFWPASLFLWPAARALWRNRLDPAFRFLLAWIVPSWAVFEIVPTKLPHYVMPTYPALAVAVAAVVLGLAPGGFDRLSKWLLRGSAAIWALVGLIAAAAVALAPRWLGPGISPLEAGLGALGAVLVMAGLYWAWTLRMERAVAAALAAAVILYGTALQLSGPRLDKLFLSPRLAEAVERQEGGGDLPVISTGYAEPSLVFLLGTDTKLAPPREVPAFLKAHPDAVLILSDGLKERVLDSVEQAGMSLEAVDKVDGVDRVLTLYRRTDRTAADRSR
ncbi:MAG: ArnT family glycosyltransferase [Alphaproteobacteria bacterium]